MSTFGQMLLEMELIHNTLHGPSGEFDPLCRFCVDKKSWENNVMQEQVTEEEKQMAVYDHARSDEEMSEREETEVYE